MSIFDKTTEETEEKKEKYFFASGSVDDFTKSFLDNKQETDVEEIPDFEESEFEHGDEEPLQKVKATKSVSKATGHLVAVMLDSTISQTCGLISGGDATKYKADEEQKSELEEAISAYVQVTGMDMPPAVALIILIVSIYGGKIAMSFSDRKKNKADEEKENKVASLEKQIRELENQLERAVEEEVKE